MRAWCLLLLVASLAFSSRAQLASTEVDDNEDNINDAPVEDYGSAEGGDEGDDTMAPMMDAEDNNVAEDSEEDGDGDYEGAEDGDLDHHRRRPHPHPHPRPPHHHHHHHHHRPRPHPGPKPHPRPHIRLPDFLRAVSPKARKEFFQIFQKYQVSVLTKQQQLDAMEQWAKKYNVSDKLAAFEKKFLDKEKQLQSNVSAVIGKLPDAFQKVVAIHSNTSLTRDDEKKAYKELAHQLGRPTFAALMSVVRNVIKPCKHHKGLGEEDSSGEGEEENIFITIEEEPSPSSALMLRPDAQSKNDDRGFFRSRGDRYGRGFGDDDRGRGWDSGEGGEDMQRWGPHRRGDDRPWGPDRRGDDEGRRPWGPPGRGGRGGDDRPWGPPGRRGGDWGPPGRRGGDDWDRRRHHWPHHRRHEDEDRPWGPPRRRGDDDEPWGPPPGGRGGRGGDDRPWGPPGRRGGDEDPWGPSGRGGRGRGGDDRPRGPDRRGGRGGDSWGPYPPFIPPWQKGDDRRGGDDRFHNDSSLLVRGSPFDRNSKSAQDSTPRLPFFDQYSLGDRSSSLGNGGDDVDGITSDMDNKKR